MTSSIDLLLLFLFTLMVVNIVLMIYSAVLYKNPFKPLIDFLKPGINIIVKYCREIKTKIFR